MKTVLILLLAAFLFVSCARQFTPSQAASRGMKCGRGVLR